MPALRIWDFRFAVAWGLPNAVFLPFGKGRGKAVCNFSVVLHAARFVCRLPVRRIGKAGIQPSPW